MATKEIIDVRLPKMYPKQDAAIFCPQRYSIIEASTKTGKTVGCMAWIFREAYTRGGQERNFWWIAPTLPVAKIAYRRMKKMLGKADPNRTIWDYHQTESRISLVNGASIWFKGSDDPDSLYGEDVYAGVVDEATRCKEDAWFALRSTLTATRGPVRIIGNVKGRKNWAYNLARKAQSGESDMAYFKLTAWDAVEGGVLDKREIEDAERLLPTNVFRELYLAEPSDDGGNPFGIGAIQACYVDPSRWHGGDVPTHYGVDLAKKHDWTVSIGIDKYGAVSRMERWQAPWNDTMRRLETLLGTSPALIDSTGVGDPIVEQLQRSMPNVTGFQFTSKTKQQIMEGLAVAIQRGEVAFSDPVLKSELESFEYVYTRTGVQYSAPEGMFDDTVCAFALALHNQRTAPVTVVENRARQTLGNPENADKLWKPMTRVPASPHRRRF